MPIINPIPEISWGTFVSTLTNTTNVTNSTFIHGFYLRVGNRVLYSFVINITPTALSTVTALDMTLPIAPAINFATSDTASGAAAVGGIASQSGSVNSLIGTMQARLSFVPVDLSTRSWRSLFMYETE
jgi:hypothetical protein